MPEELPEQDWYEQPRPLFSSNATFPTTKLKIVLMAGPIITST
jgi:hypothetical protein